MQVVTNRKDFIEIDTKVLLPRLSEVILYLLCKQWKNTHKIVINKELLFEKEINGQRLILWVPISNQVVSFASKVQQVIRSLAFLENRTGFEVASDMLTINNNTKQEN